VLGKRFNPTGAWDRFLRPLKYLVLATIIALTWWTGSLVFRDYDPFLAFFHLGEHMEELKWAYSILAVVLVGSFFIERFFCKYACPLGAVIGVLGKIGIMRIERDTQDCKECNLCQKKCPAHVEFLPHTVIRSAECNHCLDCVVDCPKPNVLSVRGMKLRFSHATYAVVLLGGFFGLIGISQLSGKWQTKPERLVATDQAGVLDAGAIRGWMTLQEISAAYGIPLGTLYQGTGLAQAVPPGTRLNKVGEEFQEGFSPEAVREFVESYLSGHPNGATINANGLSSPVEAADAAAVTEPVAVPSAEVSTERKAAGNGAATSTRSAVARAGASTLVKPGQRGDGAGGSGRGTGGENGAGKGDGKGIAAAHADGQEPEVKGFMTLNEIVLKTGVPKTFLLQKLGLSDDVPGTLPVRSWMHDRGKSISDLRDAVAAWRAQQNKE
jgi:Pyruvate/2-oxoacid:ferredoxin oxidoreductase delta subunit